MSRAESEIARNELRSAISSVARADEVAWRAHTAAALDADEDVADATSRAALKDRLGRAGVRADGLSMVVSSAEHLEAVTAGGPFACPAFLFELAMRRAFDEPGCIDGVDRREAVHAAVETAGLLDLYQALVPPGWSTVVYLHPPDRADGEAAG